MKKFLYVGVRFLPVLSPLLLVGCTDATAPSVLPLASCPVAAANVLKVSYDSQEGSYLIFHTAPGIPNPLTLKNLQMAQIPSGESSTSTAPAAAGAAVHDFARMTFSRKSDGCYPILEMTQGYKIELDAAPGSGGGMQANNMNGGGGGSFWSPFLMGAMMGNMLSRPAPAYYMPPPVTAGAGGVVGGGVSAASPAELDKKYENTYKQAPPSKKGFFSRGNSTSSTASKPADSSKKSGFFSRGNGNSGGQKSGGSFFRKKR